MTHLALALLLLAGSTHAQSWVELKPTGEAPQPRTNAAGIYDPVGHRLIVSGGQISGNITSDVWALNLEQNTWTRLAGPGAGPTPRFTHNAIYDPIDHRMVVWSGRRGDTNYNDLWAFDLSNNTWSEIAAADPKPNPRYGTAAIYDPLTDRLINFAGFTDTGRFNDTWAYDPRAGIWTEHRGELSPGARCLHTASYDPLGHRMIVFGGQRGSDALNDLWALDLDTYTWTEFTPATGPAGRTFAASVYDAGSHRLLTFGGAEIGGGGVKSDETWAFDLARQAWSLLQPGGNTPPARGGAVAIYIESENRVLMFSGAANEGLLNDVWALADLTSMPTTTKRESWGRLKRAPR